MSIPIPAASLIARTRAGRILFAERQITLPFLGGFHVFPGGQIDRQDAEVAAQLWGNQSEAPRAAALRELAEETGLALRGDRLVRLDPDLRQRDLIAISRAVGGVPDPARLSDAGRWITPEVVPIRFDTAFFLLDVESGEEAAPDGEELARVEWSTPAEILARWRRFAVLMVAPTLVMVRALAEGAAAARLAALPELDLDYAETICGIRQLPLLTPTLPPARHTNCYLVGHRRLIAVDPATYEEAERARLLRALEGLEAEGARLERVVLTHHHGDHVGSAQWLADRRGVPVAAHPKTAELLRGTVEVQDNLQDGDRLDLGPDAAGEPFVLELLHTPGHAAGHLVLKDLRPGSGAMIAGDMIAAIGTIIVDPDEGDMAEYVRQLARLRDLEPRILFPAHGPGVIGGRAKLQQYIDHRALRENKVLAALERARSGTAEQLLPDAYDDTPRELYALAERSCLAHLIKLAAEGRATRQGDRFAAA